MRKRPPSQPLDAPDPHDVGADAVDVGAERLQEPGGVLHVGFAGRVQDHGLAVRGRRGHQRVLGRRDGGFVEEDLGIRVSPAWRIEKPRPASTSAPRPLNARRWVSTRRRPMKSPPGSGSSTAPQRASSGPARRTDARMRLQSSGSRDVVRMSAARERELVGTDLADADADVVEQREHRVHVADVRDVFEDHLLVGEQACGQDRQGRVLVAAGRDCSRERSAALDDKPFGHRP